MGRTGDANSSALGRSGATRARFKARDRRLRLYTVCASGILHFVVADCVEVEQHFLPRALCQMAVYARPLVDAVERKVVTDTWRMPGREFGVDHTTQCTQS